MYEGRRKKMNEVNEKKDLRETQESNLQKAENISDFDKEVDEKIDEYLDGRSLKELHIMKDEVSKIKEEQESGSRQKDPYEKFDEYLDGLSPKELQLAKDEVSKIKDELESDSSESDEAPVKVLRFKGFTK